MKISISKSDFLSSNNRNKIKVKNYNLNKENLKAIVVVIHGMIESKEIYSEFAEFLALKGFGVITYDHIGHGESINTVDDRGFFANEEGYKYLVDDLKHVISEAKKFNLPIFLFGHSMGSLVAREYVSSENNDELDGLILSGTIGPQWAIDGAIQFANFMVESKGPRYRSRKLMKVVTAVSEWKFDDMKYSLEWSTRDRKYIEEIKADESVNYIFTAAGFKDIFTLVKNTGKKENIEKISKSLPILMVTGSDDILGENTEGVKRLYELYKNAGIKDITLNIYEKSRHALLNDLDKLKVSKDISDWMDIVLYANNDKSL